MARAFVGVFLANGTEKPNGCLFFLFFFFFGGGGRVLSLCVFFFSLFLFLQGMKGIPKGSQLLLLFFQVLSLFFVEGGGVKRETNTGDAICFFCQVLTLFFVG